MPERGRRLGRRPLPAAARGADHRHPARGGRRHPVHRGLHATCGSPWPRPHRSAQRAARRGHQPSSLRKMAEVTNTHEVLGADAHRPLACGRRRVCAPSLASTRRPTPRADNRGRPPRVRSLRGAGRVRAGADPRTHRGWGSRPREPAAARREEIRADESPGAGWSQAAMAHRDPSVSAPCRDLGIRPVTLYRYVGPQAELREEGQRVLLEQRRGRGAGEGCRQRVLPRPILVLQRQERLHCVVPLLGPRPPVHRPAYRSRDSPAFRRAR